MTIRRSLVQFYHRFGSPPHFYRLSSDMLPTLHVAWVSLITVGLWGGLFLAPPDYQQGDSFRIIFVHVPAAWMSLAVYMAMAVFAFIALVWRMKIAETMALASAPIGAAFTFVTLVTGMLWGKPMWGAYWVWDARLTSELILLFLYLGIMGLGSALQDPRKSARAACFLILVGLVNIPIIKYSVEWWTTLHQGATVRVTGESSIHPDMLWPLVLTAIGCQFFYAATLLDASRTRVLETERSKNWVRQLFASQSA